MLFERRLYVFSLLLLVLKKIFFITFCGVSVSFVLLVYVYFKHVVLSGVQCDGDLPWLFLYRC